MGPPDWWDRARCSGIDVFFDPQLEDEAKRLCAQCPVQEPCLAYALETHQPDGVWGGLNPRERATAGGAPLDTVIYTTRARSTGATCSAGRTPNGWGAACLSHGTTASAQSRTAAEQAVSRPQEWCPDCSLVAEGEAPRPQ